MEVRQDHGPRVMHHQGRGRVPRALRCGDQEQHGVPPPEAHDAKVGGADGQLCGQAEELRDTPPSTVLHLVAAAVHQAPGPSGAQGLVREGSDGLDRLCVLQALSWPILQEELPILRLHQSRDIAQVNPRLHAQRHLPPSPIVGHRPRTLGRARQRHLVVRCRGCRRQHQRRGRTLRRHGARDLGKEALPVAPEGVVAEELLPRRARPLRQQLVPQGVGEHHPPHARKPIRAHDDSRIGNVGCQADVIKGADAEQARVLAEDAVQLRKVPKHVGSDAHALLEHEHGLRFRQARGQCLLEGDLVNECDALIYVRDLLAA
mmetsp:Transcript_65498/g.213231  ORF Transcript_65498/g.213231 Transcript_65498/m.213231 type:complete len:318 (-) Transcript_65498:848-1801(-)